MTGDDLITKVTEATSHDEALSIALRAPARARAEALDLLYIDDLGLGKTGQAKAIVREARS
jgi:hypothetical protein